MRAVLAAGNVPAEGCRATAHNRTHDLQLGEAHVAAIGLTPSGSVVAEEIRDLQSGTHHERAGRLCRRLLRWRARRD
jgi:hypothetical protein